MDIVSSGEEAIQKVKENKPSLVLMDIQMAGDINGLEAGNHSQAICRVPIVYLTADLGNYAGER